MAGVAHLVIHCFGSSSVAVFEKRFFISIFKQCPVVSANFKYFFQFTQKKKMIIKVSFHFNHLLVSEKNYILIFSRLMWWSLSLLSNSLKILGKNNFVLRWYPSWIYDWHIQFLNCRVPSNDYPCKAWFISKFWENLFFPFPIWSYAKTISCVGGHLAFLINTKRRFWKFQPMRKHNWS